MDSFIPTWYKMRHKYYMTITLSIGVKSTTGWSLTVLMLSLKITLNMNCGIIAVVIMSIIIIEHNGLRF